MTEKSLDKMTLDDIIRWFGSSLHQSEENIQAALTILQNNWITSFEQYQQLSPAHRAQVGLPLLLEQNLETLIEIVTKNNNTNKSLSDIMKSSQQCQTVRTFTQEQKNKLHEEQMQETMPADTSCTNFCYLYRNNKENLIVISLIQKSWTFPAASQVESLLNELEAPSQLLMRIDDRLLPVNSKTKLAFAIKPGRILQIGGRLHRIMDNYQFKGVESWLMSLGLHKYAYTFYQNYIDEFLVVPFLRNADLEQMGITNPEEKRKILSSVKSIQDNGNFDYMSDWLEHLGFGKYSKVFTRNYFEICFLNRLKESHLERIGVLPEDRAQIFEIVRQYSEFSSVEATYIWLRDHGFEEDSFQFVRFNIPFYALPMVNYFIINEMGITNYIELLDALKQLKDTPAYQVKAMAYWLRDLELERYSLIFAKNLLVNFIEALTILTDSQICRLIEYEDDQEKMKSAVHDMKEVQLYFSTTASLLQDLLIDKYSNAFASFGITIDMLPLLTCKKLEEMGVSDVSDRAKILSRVEKMKEEVPLASSPSVLLQPSCCPRPYFANR